MHEGDPGGLPRSDQLVMNARVPKLVSTFARSPFPSWLASCAESNRFATAPFSASCTPALTLVAALAFGTPAAAAAAALSAAAAAGLCRRSAMVCRPSGAG